MTRFLDLEDALRQVKYLGFHVRDLGLLQGCLARPETTLFGDDAYPTLSHKAAALLHSVATSHRLIDDSLELDEIAHWLTSRLEVSPLR